MIKAPNELTRDELIQDNVKLFDELERLRTVYELDAELYRHAIIADVAERKCNIIPRRDYFAAMAMQGWISGSWVGSVTHPRAEMCAAIAVKCADALITELAKQVAP